MNFTINYGFAFDQIDVTEVAYQTCVKQNVMYIPPGDDIRINLFTDPCVGAKKRIYFVNNISGVTYVCDDVTELFIDLNNDKVYMMYVPDDIRNIFVNTGTKE